jgi:TPP-dependent indolepyruvate ferredoxin oxidoreductase alpha subunit
VIINHYNGATTMTGHRGQLGTGISVRDKETEVVHVRVVNAFGMIKVGAVEVLVASDCICQRLPLEIL